MFKISKITLAAAIMLTSAACHKTEEPISGGGPVEGERVEMTFGFTTSDMSRPTTSIPLEPTENSGSEAAANAQNATAAQNAAAAQSDLSMTVTLDDAVTRAEEVGTDEENKINNIWVLQFDGTDGASKLVTRDYYSTVVDNALSVSLIGYDGNIRAYFVANVGDGYFNSLSTSSTTLADFEAMDFDFAPTLDTSFPAGGLPMVGVFEGSITSGNSVTLTRMASKIVFNCNVALASDTDKFAVSSVQLVSAAAGSAFSAPEVPTATTGHRRRTRVVATTQISCSSSRAT